MLKTHYTGKNPLGHVAGGLLNVFQERLVFALSWAHLDSKEHILPGTDVMKVRGL